jgi:hypothetical protein
MCEVDGTPGTVGSRRESLASYFNCHVIPVGSDSHRRNMGGQRVIRENKIGVIHDIAINQVGIPSDGSAGRDTHIPAVDRGKNTIESDGGSSVDSEVCTNLVVDRGLETGLRAE